MAINLNRFEWTELRPRIPLEKGSLLQGEDKTIRWAIGSKSLGNEPEDEFFVAAISELDQGGSRAPGTFLTHEYLVVKAFLLYASVSIMELGKKNHDPINDLRQGLETGTGVPVEGDAFKLTGFLRQMIET